jgi:mannose-6-phosphate isomerase-like protein (cupin superfamily)
MTAAPRRVVTGHDKNGKSIVLSDGFPPIELKFPERGVAFFEIWSTNASPAPLSAAEVEPTHELLELAAKSHGTVIRILDFLPGFSKETSGTRPFVHRTESVDYGVVLEGEMVLLLDDSEVHLKAGDVVIQRGTDHAWENRSDRPARMAFILVDGAFCEELKASLPPGALDRVIRGPLRAARG